MIIEMNDKECKLTSSNENKVDKVLYHFYPNILAYLCKNDRLNVSMIDKEFYNIIFPNIHPTLTLTSKYDQNEVSCHNEFNNSVKAQILVNSINEPKQSFKNLDWVVGLESLNLSNLTVDADLLKKVEKVVSNSVIDVFSQSNISFDCYQSLEIYYNVLNEITAHISEIKVYGVSNKDKLILHLEKNNKKLNFLALKSVTLDNLPLSQISFMLETVLDSRKGELERLMIEHCALDEELGHLVNSIAKYKNLKVLSLSNCGLSSYAAKDAFKLILKNLKSLTTLFVKGVWIECAQMVDLCETISKINTIEVLNFSHSGSLLADSFGIESNFFRVLNGLNKITELDLTDCKMRSLNVRRLLDNLEISNNLRTLNLRKNYLDDDSISHLIEFNVKLTNLCDLVLSLNPMITTKGFITLIKEMSENNLLLGSLQTLSIVSCRIALGQSNESLIQLFFARSENESDYVPSIDMMFCDVKDKDIVQFLDLFLAKSDEKYKASKKYQQIKCFLKIKRDITAKADLLKKIETKLSKCYIRHNLTVK